MRTSFLTALAVAAALLAATDARAATEHLHANLSTDAEVPAKPTKGAGTADVTLDTLTHQVTYTIDYKDLTGPATVAHFHGPAAIGANAGVLVPIGGPLASPIKGTVTLTDAQQQDLLSGQTYINIHTDVNKGGEIRGQVERTK